jgi:hypothetical protein
MSTELKNVPGSKSRVLHESTVAYVNERTTCYHVTKLRQTTPSIQVTIESERNKTMTYLTADEAKALAAQLLACVDDAAAERALQAVA